MSYGRLGADGSQYMPSVKGHASFNPDDMCCRLHDAMEGSGTDEGDIVEIIGGCNAVQKQELKQSYKGTYGKDLVDDLKDELSGEFKSLVKMAMLTSAECAAKVMYKAMEGGGTDEETIVEVLCTLTNNEIEELKRAYGELVKEKDGEGDETSLETRIDNELDGNLKRICIALLQASRNEPSEAELREAFDGNIATIVNYDLAKEQAQKLYEAGEDKWGTDEESFISMLVKQSCWQICAINQAYAELSDNSLMDVIESEFGGDSETALKTILACALNRPKFFAKQLRNAMAGLGTCDEVLIYLIVSRSQLDMETVKMAYEAEYECSLADAIRGDTDGDYQALLLKLCGE